MVVFNKSREEQHYLSTWFCVCFVFYLFFSIRLEKQMLLLSEFWLKIQKSKASCETLAKSTSFLSGIELPC